MQFCVFADHFTLPGQHHREWTRDEREVGLTRPANKPPVPIKNNLKNAVMPEKSQSSLPLPVPFITNFILTVAIASGNLDVNAFTAAREFEISALQNAMRTSKYIYMEIGD